MLGLVPTGRITEDLMAKMEPQVLEDAVLKHLLQIIIMVKLMQDTA